MALESGFFNSVGGDRLYNADDMSRYFENILSNGIFKRIDNCLKVSPAGGMELNVAAGAGLINCRWFRATSAETVTIPAAHAVLPRFDIVVARLDMRDSVRSITLQVLSGTPAENPFSQEPVRDEMVHDLVLALVYVPAGASAITAENLTDVRDNEWYCGYVQSLVDTPIIKKLHSRYIAPVNDTTVAPINVMGFNHNVDLLNVYVNGFRLAPDTEYTVGADTTSITLEEAVDAGTIIDIEVYKPFMANDISNMTQTVLGLVQSDTSIRTSLSAETSARAAAFAQVAPIGPGVFAFDGAQVVSGFISSESKRLYFSIPFNRVIDATGVNIRTMNVQVRQGGGYILGSASTWHDISGDLYSATISKNGMLMLTFAPTFDSTPANNAECGIHIEATAEIEFT